MKKLNRDMRGFTFLEIMFVVVIIGILAAIVGPNLVGKSEKARITTTKAQMNSIQTALQAFEMNVGRFPTTEEGLDALVKCPSDVSEDMWDSPYLEEIPKDAWDNAFVYKYPGDNAIYYDLYSYGPDGQEETEDDITNWKKEDEAL